MTASAPSVHSPVAENVTYDDIWLFGYGSLIWRPDFEFLERQPAVVHGFKRRFWQGSHDHRGVPAAPGRVVTLVSDPGSATGGVAYRISSHVHRATFAVLDHREKNGYQRRELSIELRDGRSVAGLVYFAAEGNFAYLGPAPLEAMATQVSASVGPSGHNADYLAELAQALRALDIDDPHVFALEAAVAATRCGG